MLRHNGHILENYQVEASGIGLWQTLCINDVIADNSINTQGLSYASKIIADIGLMS